MIFYTPSEEYQYHFRIVTDIYDTIHQTTVAYLIEPEHQWFTLNAQLFETYILSRSKLVTKGEMLALLL